MLKSEGDRLTKVVVCTPKTEYFNISNLNEHNITQIAYKDKTIQQHNKLKSILEESGCEIIDVPELPNHPNSVFTRDTSLCTPKGYIKLKMGLNSRRGEEVWMAEILDSMGETNAGSIESLGTVEGGDVILAGSVAFVGHSQRTNNNGVEQISNLLESMKYEVRSITVPSPYLHLGGAMSLVGTDLILSCRGVFSDDFFKGFKRIEISSETFVSGNVINLGNKEVIADSKNVEVIKELKRAKIKVHTIDLSEFIKGQGGPSCLIMPVERK
jgi:dimethylargininase